MEKGLKGSLSDIRGDIWHNNSILMVGGESMDIAQSESPSDAVSSKTKIYNLNTFESYNLESEMDYSAQGIAQCVYNDDTFISWGGWDQKNKYFDNFTILGGMSCYTICVSSVLSLNIHFSTF